MRADTQVSATAGWRGVGLIVITYFYFLIFAQFAFLKRLNELSVAGEHLNWIMAAMACGGILFSLLSGRFLWSNPALQMCMSLAGCGLTACGTLVDFNLYGGMVLAFLIGTFLAVLTVTLVSNLQQWIGQEQALLKVGVGTGIAYFLCNCPVVFEARPRAIALLAGALCLIAIPLVNRVRVTLADEPLKADRSQAFPLLLVLFWFTALVWLDSAGFYIIQNSPALKSGTWTGSTNLWRNGTLHLFSAILSGWLLSRGRMIFVLAMSFLMIAGACLLLHRADHRVLASTLYPIGVSFYSVALVAYPSFLMNTSATRSREFATGVLYAIAGWMGSALGIGMGQHLHQVPTYFVVGAGMFMTAPLLPSRWRGRLPPVTAIAALALAAVPLQRIFIPRAETGTSTVDRGRKVYIAEGCINCHSQYIRPRTEDEIMWGPPQNIDEVRRQQPPLIGNRRQGPDLSDVGVRRSALWLRIHFYNPRDVNAASIMPSYSYLFRDGRGDALISYMLSLRAPGDLEHLHHLMATWSPQSGVVDRQQALGGRRLFQEHCATCHETGGKARVHWPQLWKNFPPDLLSGIPSKANDSEATQELKARLERTIKFGKPGSDMPGHEYLSDGEIQSITNLIMNSRTSMYQ